MDTYEAKKLLADSLRCLARSMDQIRLRELEKVMGDDEPMQETKRIQIERCLQEIAGPVF